MNDELADQLYLQAEKQLAIAKQACVTSTEVVTHQFHNTQVSVETATEGIILYQRHMAQKVHDLGKIMQGLEADAVRKEEEVIQAQTQVTSLREKWDEFREQQEAAVAVYQKKAENLVQEMEAKEGLVSTLRMQLSEYMAKAAQIKQIEAMQTQLEQQGREITVLRQREEQMLRYAALKDELDGREEDVSRREKEMQYREEQFRLKEGAINDEIQEARRLRQQIREAEDRKARELRKQSTSADPAERLYHIEMAYFELQKRLHSEQETTFRLEGELEVTRKQVRHERSLRQKADTLSKRDGVTEIYCKNCHAQYKPADNLKNECVFHTARLERHCKPCDRWTSVSAGPDACGKTDGSCWHDAYRWTCCRNPDRWSAGCKTGVHTH